ncbi:hypothetical protein C2845_PM01G22140 [Panicum miliaceum]|uniref:Uncharacterized protein n=1 Tax=Panicum miliaceum TaxID=4540 RepID=A0A3L6THQ3_PANMI|nr:hypothetical protein C2845_PM01G22140 [Panicum miliaceum]
MDAPAPATAAAEAPAPAVTAAVNARFCAPEGVLLQLREGKRKATRFRRRSPPFPLPSGGLCGVGEDGERGERGPVYIAFVWPPAEPSPAWAVVVPDFFAEKSWLVVPLGVGGEAMAAAALSRNKSSRALPRSCGAPLRRHRRARGGGAPGVEPVYRRCSPAVRRPGREVRALAFCFVDGEAAADLADARRVERAWTSHGCSGRQRQVCIHGRRSSGRGPGRWAISVGFISPLCASVSCGSYQSLLAMELLLTSGDQRLESAAASGSGGRRQTLERSVHIGSRDFDVISLFLRSLCENRIGQLSSVSFQNVPVFVWVFVRYP